MQGRRIGGLFAVFVLLLAVAALRSVYLGTIASGRLREAAQTQQATSVVVPGLRGTIFDRTGIPLAISEPADDISADPNLIKNPDAEAAEIAPILGLGNDAVAATLATANTGFVYVARQVPDGTAQQVGALNLPGITLTPTQLRVYPDNDLAAQVLGGLHLDGSPAGGLEDSLNTELAGVNGTRQIVSDALGKTISVKDEKVAKPGSPITLTLDAALEQRAESVLGEVGQEWRPLDATAIVMDPRTNAILAMANWPRVNANEPGQAPASALENRAVEMNFEPGSTFKVVTIGGALMDDDVTPETNFYLPSDIQVADRTIHDDEPRGPETLSVSQILAQSSNVGAVKIGELVGPNRFNYWVRQFGFGALTGVNLPGEEQGIVLQPSQYSGSSMGNLPIGQGESVTPIQLATAYSAIANGGILRPAHIVADVGDTAVPEPTGHRILTPEVSSELRTMLEGVLEPGGTAAAVSIPGYTLAGKTGTANKVDPATGTYSDTNYVASFVGFAPAQNPQVLVAVIVDQPQGAITGAQVAAPAWGQMMSFALPYLKIPPG